MARMRRKGDLPQRLCAACGRPFTWRRKWARMWEEVRYCSQACRRRRGDFQAKDETDPPQMVK